MRSSKPGPSITPIGITAPWWAASSGFVSRRRFALALGLLPQRIPRLLEIGYGSGIFMPALAQRATELSGVDVHKRPEAVAGALATHGVTATLITASAEHLPYADAAFDAVVSISAFEFIDDAARAADEIRRVLTPGGVAVVVMPGTSPLLDLALRVTTGESAERDYEGRRDGVLPAFKHAFVIDRIRTFPPLIGRVLPVYRAYALRPKP